MPPPAPYKPSRTLVRHFASKPAFIRTDGVKSTSSAVRTCITFAGEMLNASLITAPFG